MKKLLKKTSGYKTYAVCVAMVVVVLFEYQQTGVLNQELLLQALALAGLRAAV